MIDTTKRTTLKIISGATAMIAAPSIVTAGFLEYGDNGKGISSQNKTIKKPQLMAGSSLTIALLLNPEPTLRMTNHSSELVILRHVSPGILHAGDRVFDINSIFTRCSYAIAAGTTRHVSISPCEHLPLEISSDEMDKGIPDHLQQRQRHSLALTSRDHNGRLAHSSQHIFV